MISMINTSPEIIRIRDSFRKKLITESQYPIRDIFRRFYPEYEAAHPELPAYKRSTARMIMRCKTGDLGYSVSVCEECGSIHIHNASCNNRSCPCCQHPQEKKWVAERQTELIIGSAYYHVIFTVPHDLNDLFITNEKLLYSLLFKCVSDTLLALCADRRYMGAKPAIISVLHTWGQKLNYHPHVHVCLSGGGLTVTQNYTETRHKGFIIPEKVIASSFRGRFLCALKKLRDAGKLCLPELLEDPNEWKSYVNKLFSTEWLPFVKETFNGKGNAIEYLGRYSYRTAISNSRIVSFDEKNVTFRFRDYADNSAQKTLTVSGTDFIEMFLRHVLPKGFSRIRYSGILTNSQKTRNLKRICHLHDIQYLGNPYKNMKMRELILCLFDSDIECCPSCGGSMILRESSRGQPRMMAPSHSSTPFAAMC